MARTTGVIGWVSAVEVCEHTHRHMLRRLDSLNGKPGGAEAANAGEETSTEVQTAGRIGATEAWDVCIINLEMQCIFHTDEARAPKGAVDQGLTFCRAANQRLGSPMRGCE